MSCADDAYAVAVTKIIVAGVAIAHAAPITARLTVRHSGTVEARGIVAGADTTLISDGLAAPNPCTVSDAIVCRVGVTSVAPVRYARASLEDWLSNISCKLPPVQCRHLGSLSTCATIGAAVWLHCRTGSREGTIGTR